MILRCGHGIVVDVVVVVVVYLDEQTNKTDKQTNRQGECQNKTSNILNIFYQWTVFVFYHVIFLFVNIQGGNTNIKNLFFFFFFTNHFYKNSFPCLIEVLKLYYLLEETNLQIFLFYFSFCFYHSLIYFVKWNGIIFLWNFLWEN